MIQQMLMSESMPLFEVDRFLGDMLVAELNGDVVGCAGLEIYGASAILRSVVVDPALRGTTLGRRLCNAALSVARDRGIRDVCLFTMNAAPFFTRMGFENCSIDDFPEALQQSTQVSSLREHPQMIDFLTAMRLSIA